jgi:NADH dehydrogenase FAD-containing subunit
MLSSKAQVYALGDMAEPVTQYEPIGQELFTTVQAAVDYAKGHGWQILRIEQ